MILITRPSQQANQTKAKLKQLGFKAVCYPFLRIEILSPSYNALNYDALVITSQNAVNTLNAPAEKLIFSVGNATARALKKHGFNNVISADGDIQDLIKLIPSILPAPAKLLYVRGDHVSVDIIPQLKNYTIDEVIVYKSIAIMRVSKHLIKLLNHNIRYIMFYSARTAKAYSNVIKERESLTAICISNKVAQELNSLNFKEIIVADHPNEEAMIKLLSM